VQFKGPSARSQQKIVDTRGFGRSEARKRENQAAFMYAGH
jgi:hypothetical protein